MKCICTEIINSKPDAGVNPDCSLHGSLSTVKDEEKKDCPCFLPYDQIPKEQHIKYSLFKALVESFKSTII